MLVEKDECYFSLTFHYFIYVCKAPPTKPVCVVLALSPPFLPEPEDHWKAILGKANFLTVIYTMLSTICPQKTKDILSLEHK